MRTNSDPSRYCADQCTEQIGCRDSRKKCLCDGDCGYSCIYPSKYIMYWLSLNCMRSSQFIAVYNKDKYSHLLPADVQSVSVYIKFSSAFNTLIYIIILSQTKRPAFTIKIPLLITLEELGVWKRMKILGGNR